MGYLFRDTGKFGDHISCSDSYMIEGVRYEGFSLYLYIESVVLLLKRNLDKNRMPTEKRWCSCGRRVLNTSGLNCWILWYMYGSGHGNVKISPHPSHHLVWTTRTKINILQISTFPLVLHPKPIDRMIG